MAAQPPQPNFPLMHEALQGLTNQVALLPNIPGLNPPEAPNIHQIHQELIDFRAQTNQTLGRIDQTLARINARLERDLVILLPMRLFNATVSLNAPLRFPPGEFNAVPPLPESRAALFTFTIAQCNAAVNALGLHAPPANTPVMERRRQIAEYLGCPM